MQRALGRIQSHHDPRTIRLRPRPNTAAPPLPDAVRWDTAVPSWTVGGNDQYGNCVIATAAHMVALWDAATHNGITPPDDPEIIDLSRSMGALRGYEILDRLKYWRKQGMWGGRLWAYAQYRTTDLTQHKRAIADTGCADIGLALPAAWQDDKIWDIGQGRRYLPGSWGLHSVPLVGYDVLYFYCVTWGKIQALTPAALIYYCDEAWQTISPDWLIPNGRTPAAYDLNQLYDDLHAATM